jgi:hypothetical protein
MFGPMGLSKAISTKAKSVSSLQTNYLYHATLLVLIGSTILLGARQYWLVFGEFTDYRLFILFFISGFYLKTSWKK